MNKHERAIEAAFIEYKNAIVAYKNFMPLKTEQALKIAIDAYLAVMREPGPDEVRVRGVAQVNKTADASDAYDLVGWSNANDAALLTVARRVRVGVHGSQFHFIEANIPAWRPPVEETVEGEVVA